MTRFVYHDNGVPIDLDRGVNSILLITVPMAAKSLNRLSRDSIIGLVRHWLRDPQCPPYLLSNRQLFEADEEDYLHAPAENVESLRNVYRELEEDLANFTKRDIVDRIVDGDWRRGLSLHQHAMIDLAHLEQNDTALRWSALQLVPLEAEESKADEKSDSQSRRKRRKLSHDNDEVKYPQVSAPAFLAALKAEISPLVKAHYHIHRLPAPSNMSIIRLYISPNSTFRPSRSSIPRRAKQATDGARIVYIALPESCPYIYISLSGSTSSSKGRKGAQCSKEKSMAKVDMAGMKKIIIEAIPKALSRPQQRWALESTNLTVRSLRSIAALRGGQDPGSGGGAYSAFCGKESLPNKSPIDVQQPEPRHQKDERDHSVEERFGSMTGAHHAPLDRFHVDLQNATQTDNAPRDDMWDKSNQDPVPLGLNFSGTDVFSGLRKLAELDPQYVDLSKMPAWMTGELGVSSLKV